MYKNVVVLIPGILGSALSKDGSEIWGASAGTIARGLTSLGRDLDALRLVDDDPSVDDLGDGVVATRLLPDIQVIPGFWKVDGYDAARAALSGGLDLVQGRNLFDFPYDWRRDTRAVARDLARKTQAWLREWRESSGNDDARLVLFAHSMGGLVARHFVEVLEGWRQTAVLATFGTPHRGSPKALAALCNGLRKAVGGYRLYDLSALVRSLTSVYQLLPTYEAFETVGGDRLRVAEAVGIPDLDRDRAAAALRFHRDIEAAQRSNAALRGYADGYRLLPFVGIEQPTMGFARAGGEGVELLRRVPGVDRGGDGTVPRFSAFPPEWANERGGTFFAQTHASLQNGASALTHLCAVLAGDEADLSRLRAGEVLTPLGLEVDDAFMADEPVTFRVTSRHHHPFLNAVVHDGDTGAPVRQLRLLPADGGFHGSMALGPGAYRIHVSAAGARPVNDVFVVGEGARPALADERQVLR